MIYLGIDFGTVWTKATLFDSEKKPKKLMPVPLEDRPDYNYILSGSTYAMPTAVYYDSSKGVYIVGQAAVNLKNIDRQNFFDKFKPQLSGEEIWASPSVKYRDLVVAVLKHVKDKAIALCNGSIDIYVITIPASTIEGDNRWNLMREAATLAGLSEIELLKEPEAAGYYSLSQEFQNAQNIEGNVYLIYDFGGGTFDCSLIKIKDEYVLPLPGCVGSDEHQRWGGIYIDNIVRQDFIRNCTQISNAVSKIRNEANTLSKESIALSEILRDKPVEAKHTLSQQSLYQGPFGYTIGIEKYNEKIEGMIDETIECCLDIIREANQNDETIKLENISAIFLVGGSSMIPLIKKKWNQKRTGKTKFKVLIGNQEKAELNFDLINAVASGAALYPSLRPSSERLIELGLKKIKGCDYLTADLYFHNAKKSEGKYWRGILYYKGVISRKPQYKKAYTLFEEANTEQARSMMALMKFKGEGTKKNDTEALALLKSITKSEIKDVLERILNGNYSQEDLDRIYSYNPLAFSKKTENAQKTEESAKGGRGISSLFTTIFGGLLLLSSVLNNKD